MLWIALATLLIVACGTGGGAPDDDDDPSGAPTVTSTTPADGATGVDLNASVSVAFDRSLSSFLCKALGAGVYRWGLMRSG
ncbi:MAG: Ig-like domain-containing protein [Trueperaceae bacterium]